MALPAFQEVMRLGPKAANPEQTLAEFLASSPHFDQETVTLDVMTVNERNICCVRTMLLNLLSPLHRKNDPELAKSVATLDATTEMSAFHEIIQKLKPIAVSKSMLE